MRNLTSATLIYCSSSLRNTREILRIKHFRFNFSQQRGTVFVRGVSHNAPVTSIKLSMDKDIPDFSIQVFMF